MATHSERAEEMAELAARELSEVLEASQGGVSALGDYGRPPVWERITAIQAQAQISRRSH